MWLAWGSSNGTRSPGPHLAGAQDLEEQRQAVGEQLLGVLLLLDAAELLQQALDQRPAVLQEAGAQGLQPGVQRPGHTCTRTATPPRVSRLTVY